MKQLILPKIISVGIYNAQIAMKNKAVTQNRKTTMFEIEIPMEEGGVSYIDDTSSPISEHVVICAKPGQFRHTRLPFKCYYVHMIINEGQLFDILSSLPNYMEFGDASQIREVFVSLCEHYNRGSPKDDLMLQSLILKLVYILDRNAPDFRVVRSPKHSNRVIIEQTLKYIHENLASELTLETLSGMASFSPIYFHKLFKASTGKTLHEYVEEQRIQKSISLLTTTEMTLAQIAYECGFSSQSYFSSAFKKKTKLTPRAYAKKLLLRYEES